MWRHPPMQRIWICRHAVAVEWLLPARAGDAGKVLVVVATEDISTQVGALQGAMEDAVVAIQSIASSFENINESMGAIR